MGFVRSFKETRTARTTENKYLSVNRQFLSKAFSN